MANYVVDASVVIQYLITESFTLQAKLLIESINTGNRLFVPEFCLLECVNVLWKQVRFNGLDETTAEQLIIDLLDIPLEIMPVEKLLSDALKIGLNHQLAIYDSLYIALALDLNYPLITMDDRQSLAAGSTGVTLKSINDFNP